MPRRAVTLRRSRRAELARLPLAGTTNGGFRTHSSFSGASSALRKRRACRRGRTSRRARSAELARLPLAGTTNGGFRTHLSFSGASSALRKRCASRRFRMPRRAVTLRRSRRAELARLPLAGTTNGGFRTHPGFSGASSALRKRRACRRGRTSRRAVTLRRARRAELARLPLAGTTNASHAGPEKSPRQARAFLHSGADRHPPSSSLSSLIRAASLTGLVR